LFFLNQLGSTILTINQKKTGINKRFEKIKHYFLYLRGQKTNDFAPTYEKNPILSLSFLFAPTSSQCR